MRETRFFLFLVCFCSTLVAQTAGKQFTLQQAIDFALANGYSVKNAATDIEIARKKVIELRGIGLPQVKADASFQNFLQVPVSLIPAGAFDPSAPDNAYLRLPFGVQYNLSYGYTASWLVFSGEYIVGLQASRTYVDYTKSNLRKSEIEIKEGVTRAYQTLLVLNENKKILEENIKNLDRFLFETEAIQKEGFVEELDVDRIKLIRNNLKSSLDNLNQQKNLAEKLLKFQMGYDVNTSISLSETFDSFTSSIVVSATQEPKFDFSASADNRLIELGLRLQTLSHKRTLANYLPTLSTYYSWKENRVNNDLKFLTDPDFRVPGGTLLGINLSVPVFQGLSQKARVQQAKLELDKIKVLQSQASQGYDLKSSQAWSEFKAAMNTFRDRKESVSLAIRIRDRSATKYREGVGSSIELIQAENDLLSAQSNYIISAMQLMDANVSLNKQLNLF